VIIRISDAAKLDLLEGCQFYENQEENIGAYLLDSLYSDIDSLKLFAGIHRKKFGFYWMLAKTFPFAIYYEIECRDIVLIQAVVDCRQNPKSIEQRLIEEKIKRW
jgi:hypothetical protein